MACYHPIVVSIPDKSATVKPGQLLPRMGMLVGCGNCLGCRAEQARDWMIRIMHESRMHDASWFVTLTYSDEELPENGSLRPEDFRGFVKTLRKRVPSKLSYFACGEYGESTQRPHYHSVFFGPLFLDRCFHRDSPSGAVWRSPSLEAAWGRGITEFGSVTPQSAAYVAGYVRKKVSRRVDPAAYVRGFDESTGQLFEVEPEFSRMSLRPAIGKRWIEENWKDVYPRDRVVIEGKEYKPPRYYDRWMEEHQPEVIAEVKRKRLENFEERTVESDLASEAHHKARVDLFQRRNKI